MKGFVLPWVGQTPDGLVLGFAAWICRPLPKGLAYRTETRERREGPSAALLSDRFTENGEGNRVLPSVPT